MKSIENIIRPNIASLCPYSTARDEYQGPLGIFLDANESPYENGWNRYPDPHQKALKARIAEIKGVGCENVFLGNGSDEAIDMIFRVFCEPGVDNVVAISPSYGMYEVAAAINDIEVRKVQLGACFELDAEALIAAADAHTKAIFLCTPNNPSGNAFANEVIMDIAGRFDGIVVVDEAYIDFCSVPSLVSKACTAGNIVVLQTMSKARGMAALRLGMAFSCPRIISLMSMVKYPYNINRAAQDTVMEMLNHDIGPEVAEIVSERSALVEKLSGMKAVRKVYPSEANFLLVKFDDADAAYESILAIGIIVRNRNKVAGCRGCLRITVGTPDENRKLIEAISKL